MDITLLQTHPDVQDAPLDTSARTKIENFSKFFIQFYYTTFMKVCLFGDRNIWQYEGFHWTFGKSFRYAVM